MHKNDSTAKNAASRKINSNIVSLLMFCVLNVSDAESEGQEVY